MAISHAAKRMALCGIAGLGLGYVAALVSPKIYEARSAILIQGDDPDRAKRVLGDQLSTQIAMLRSEGVFSTALNRVAARTKKPDLKKNEKALFRMYSVDVAEKSAIATIRVRAYDPKTAGEIATLISETYKSKRAAATNEVENVRRESFQDRLERSKNTLEDAERRVAEYKARTNAPDLGQKTEATIAYEAGLTARLDTAKAEIQEVDGEIRTLSAEIKKRPASIEESKTVGKSTEVRALEQELADLQRQRIQLLRTFAKTSSRVTAVDEAIQETERKLVEARQKPWEASEKTERMDPQRMQLEQDRAGKLARRSALSAEIRETERTLRRVRQEMAMLPTAQRAMQKLQREYDVAAQRYQNLQQEAAKLDTERVEDTVLASELGRQVDQSPVSPNVPLLLALGTMLGVVCAGIYTFATERGRKPIRTSLDLEHLGLPMSAISALPKREEERRLKALPTSGSRPAEAYRYMALTMPPTEGAKAILFTGVGQSSGCTNAAGQFAHALSAEGRPTMLADCDFRHSSLTKVFDATQKPGLSDILRKTLLPGADNAFSFPTSHQNLQFLPSGSSGDGSIADFTHSQLRAAMEVLKSHSDYLVLDTAPCDIVTDAVRLAPLVDEIYLVVSADNTDAAKVSMAHRLLLQCGAQSVRIMLTGADPSVAPFAAA